jgi:zinc protease
MTNKMTTTKKIAFEEYDLDNGLHVILHQDNSIPTIITSVMYHVGAKNEREDRTGFAHFFEHLLFEGTQNIARGDWFKIVTANGGVNNANTTEDRTYYYEVFPSNNLELGLWMEAERMRHAVINEIGVTTQNDVVKEEKKSRYDNRPYGQLIREVKRNMFKKHPYRWITIGEMAHLDAATLEEFQDFYKTYYVPNNAVLVVAGDFETKTTKDWILKYFATIPSGKPIAKINIEEASITEPIQANYEDANIQLPMVVAAYRTPSMKTREARILDLISTILSDGKSSRLYKKIVDMNKTALQIGTFNYSQEDYGTYIIYGIPQSPNTPAAIVAEIDEEILKLQTDLILDSELQKLKNIYEMQFVNQNASIEGIAHNLANFYLLFGDADLINKEINIYNSITPEEIRAVAQKYLNPNQRLILNYNPLRNAQA